PLYGTILRPPRAALVPYTTLFRSEAGGGGHHLVQAHPRLAHAHVVGELAQGRARLGEGDERALGVVAVERGPGVVERLHIRPGRSEEHTSELQSREKLVCRLLHEK